MRGLNNRVCKGGGVGGCMRGLNRRVSGCSWIMKSTQACWGE